MDCVCYSEHFHCVNTNIYIMMMCLAFLYQVPFLLKHFSAILYSQSSEIHLMNRSSGSIYLNCMLTQIHKHKKHFYHFIRNSKKKHPSHLFQLVGCTVCARGMLLVFSICHILIRNKIRSVLYSSLFMLCRERERKKKKKYRNNNNDNKCI